jgi:hypothetical protein
MGSGGNGGWILNLAILTIKFTAAVFLDIDVILLTSTIFNTEVSSAGPHPASYPMGTRGSFSGSKTAGA